jgi:outer membrane protein OmpA-like peptidoglycan-associated protein
MRLPRAFFLFFKKCGTQEKDGLAAKRAEAVKEYCVMLGMSESQIITRHTKQILAQNEEGIFEEKDRIKARRAELMFIDAP